MAYNSLQDFLQVLEREGELKRISHPVNAELEITEIADRVMKSAGPALLFENVVGKNIPVLINAFGSAKRMALALGVKDIEEIAAEIAKLIQTRPPKIVQRQTPATRRTGETGGHPAEDGQRSGVPGSRQSRS